jgi:hypothetical protein
MDILQSVDFNSLVTTRNDCAHTAKRYNKSLCWQSIKWVDEVLGLPGMAAAAFGCHLH